MTDTATDRRHQLGRALRRARNDAGLTQRAVAEHLECTQGKINKLETTLVEIKAGDLEKMITLYRLTAEKATELRELAAEDQQDGPRRTGSAAWSAFGELSALEPDASEIMCWHSERIPGPLQSEHYMLAQHHPDMKTTPDVVRLVRRRKARAQIFTIDDPPRYRAILSESSMHRMPGGYSAELVVDQAEHLIQLMTDHRQVELHILPFGAGVRFVDTDFEILRFADGRPDFAYIEFPAGSRRFEARQDIRMFQEHWQQFLGAALSTADSAEFLRELAINATAGSHNG